MNIDSEIEYDLKIINEILILQNEFIECIIKLKKFHKTYKNNFFIEFTLRSKNLVNIFESIHVNKYKISSEKYQELYNQLEKYKEQMRIFSSMSKPLISKEKMEVLLKDQKNINDILKKVEKII